MLGADLDVGQLARGGDVPGIARLDKRDSVVEIQAGHEIDVTLMGVDGAGVQEGMARRLVHRADQPSRGLLDDPQRPAARSAQAGQRRAASGQVPPAAAIPEDSLPN